MQASCLPDDCIIFHHTDPSYYWKFIIDPCPAGERSTTTKMNFDLLKDKISGALYGVAVGDALGGPLEFMATEQIAQRYGLVTEMIGGGWLNLRPSETTDDTAMTMAVAEGIMESPAHPIPPMWRIGYKSYQTI